MSTIDADWLLMSDTPNRDISQTKSLSVESLARIGLTKAEKNIPSLTAETLRVLSRIDVDSLPVDQQFELLFNDLSMLKASAVQGSLASTNFRCIAWMIFLECLPIEKSEWLQIISANRAAYAQIKTELLCDPHRTQDPSDHPLSQSQQSVWNRYFLETGTKAVIVQDVTRINQPSAFLYLDSTKQQMIDLLFIYVKYAGIEYRQGMHEILACVVSLLHDEYTALSRGTNATLKSLADCAYVEHDAFTLFKAIMKRTHEWFGSTQQPKTQSPGPQDSIRMPIYVRQGSLGLNPKLFQENEEFYESLIINKINHISNVILRNNDIEVSTHLNKIGVSLHPFGIRWLRLLFLRELEFPSCLVLWDAIFATDNQRFGLSDYIFVALLCLLRDKLLKTDHSGCMRVLMQSHYELDALEVLSLALYLHNPAVCAQLKAIYTRPVSMENSFEFVNAVQNTPKHINQTTPKSPQPKTEIQSPLNLARISKRLESNYSIPSRFAGLKNLEMRLIKIERMQHNIDKSAFVYFQQINELYAEKKILTLKYNKLEGFYARCSTKMDVNIRVLRENIAANSELSKDNILKLAIDDLEQIGLSMKLGPSSYNEIHGHADQLNKSTNQDSSIEENIPII